jgi:hypothetical protein
MSTGNGLSERLQTPISTAELERRWKAVRAAMVRDKIDVLLMQNNNDHMGGYVKYFTDMPATNGYPNTVVFPREDEMTVVAQAVRRQPDYGALKRHLARRQEYHDHAELRLRALHQRLRSRTRHQGARTLRQGNHRSRRYLSDVLRDGRLRQTEVNRRAFCRRQRTGRPN